MPNQPNITRHVLTRLPEFLRRKVKSDCYRQPRNPISDCNGRVDEAIYRATYRNGSRWRPIGHRYYYIMAGERVTNPLRAPIEERLLTRVSMESRIPIPVLRCSTRRFPADSPVAKARILFALLWKSQYCGPASHIGPTLNMSSSFGGRAIITGNGYLEHDPEFAQRYNKLLLDIGDIQLSNLQPCVIVE